MKWTKIQPLLVFLSIVNNGLDCKFTNMGKCPMGGGALGAKSLAPIILMSSLNVKKRKIYLIWDISGPVSSAKGKSVHPSIHTFIYNCLCFAFKIRYWLIVFDNEI